MSWKDSAKDLSRAPWKDSEYPWEGVADYRSLKDSATDLSRVPWKDSESPQLETDWGSYSDLSRAPWKDSAMDLDLDWELKVPVAAARKGVSQPR